MAYRPQPIITNQIYHIYNRGVAYQPIFKDTRDYNRFIDLVDYYRFSSPNLRFSFYYRLPLELRKKYIDAMKKNTKKLVSIYAFCLIPNHFHFLLKQLTDNGIRKFTSNLQNSYAKYFNIKRKRVGSLFQEMFKAVRVGTDEQLIHLVRYIHLNPYSSYLIKDINELENYTWSSLPAYLNESNIDFIDKQLLSGFHSTTEKFKSFTFDQADYQRKINDIKHLMME